MAVWLELCLALQVSFAAVDWDVSICPDRRFPRQGDTNRPDLALLSYHSREIAFLISCKYHSKSIKFRVIKIVPVDQPSARAMLMPNLKR